MDLKHPFSRRIKKVRPLSKLIQTRSEWHDGGVLITAVNSPRLERREPSPDGPPLRQKYRRLKEQYCKASQLLRELQSESRLRRTQLKNYWKQRYEEEVGQLKVSMHQFVTKNKELEEVIQVLRFVVRFFYLNNESSRDPPILQALQQKFQSLLEERSEVGSHSHESEDNLQFQFRFNNPRSAQKKLVEDLDQLKSRMESSKNRMKATLKNLQSEQQFEISDEESESVGSRKDSIKEAQVWAEAKSPFFQNIARLKCDQQTGMEEPMLVQAMRLENILRAVRLKDQKLQIMKVFEQKFKYYNENKALKDLLRKVETPEGKDHRLLTTQQLFSSKLKEGLSGFVEQGIVDEVWSHRFSLLQQQIESLEFKVELEKQLMEFSQAQLGKQVAEKLNYLLHLIDRVLQFSCGIFMETKDIVLVLKAHQKFVESQMEDSDRAFAALQSGANELKLLLAQRKESVVRLRAEMVSSRKGEIGSCSNCLRVKEQARGILSTVSEDFESMFLKLKVLVDAKGRQLKQSESSISLDQN